MSNTTKVQGPFPFLSILCLIFITLKVKLRELIEHQIVEIEKQGRYVDVYHELRYDESVGEDRIIFWAKGEKQKNGSIKEFKAPKYVKPTATFSEPDFASCWLS